MPSNLTYPRGRRTLLVAILAAALLVPVSTAVAIQNGVPDGVGHPFVGAMLAAWRTPGVQEGWCTGTLVAPRIVLTASHCGVDELGLRPDQVWMSFDPAYIVGVSRLYHGTFVVNPEYVAYRGQGGRAAPSTSRSSVSTRRHRSDSRRCRRPGSWPRSTCATRS